MAEDKVRSTNGYPWTAQQFLDHYFQPSASGTPVPVAGPPAPVPVDMSWYMDEGPGRFYHPGMFPIINNLLERRDLAAGRYDLTDFVPNNDRRDPSLTAGISNYTRDMNSADYRTRALVFGNESARISGHVVVKPDGSKIFEGIEIRPLDTDFNFDHKTGNLPLEAARELARWQYDPGNQGASYEIPIRGAGRTYDPFTDSQLNAALRKEFVHPGSGPPGLLPSVTTASTPAIRENLRYLDQTNVVPAPTQVDRQPDIVNDKPVRTLSGAYGNTPRPPVFESNTPPARFVLPGPRNASGGIANWIAGLAGVDPQDPTQPARSPQAEQLIGFNHDDPNQPWSIRSQR